MVCQCIRWEAKLDREEGIRFFSSQLLLLFLFAKGQPPLDGRPALFSTSALSTLRWFEFFLSRSTCLLDMSSDTLLLIYSPQNEIKSTVQNESLESPPPPGELPGSPPLAKLSVVSYQSLGTGNSVPGVVVDVWKQKKVK